ncbi:UNVERIFIED_CONTAM: movement protein [Sesamum calycinum]|uniref:Movement protein n=1 Tax=Sesamum calycinum TaxID=2727403 RepID=A0AAW2K0S9_9LAMI
MEVTKADLSYLQELAESFSQLGIVELVNVQTNEVTPALPPQEGRTCSNEPPQDHPMTESEDFHTNSTPTFVRSRLRENPRRASKNKPWARTMLQPLHPYGAVLNRDVIDFRNIEKLIDEWTCGARGHIAPDCPQKRGELRKFEATNDILDYNGVPIYQFKDLPTDEEASIEEIESQMELRWGDSFKLKIRILFQNDGVKQNHGKNYASRFHLSPYDGFRIGGIGKVLNQIGLNQRKHHIIYKISSGEFAIPMEFISNVMKMQHIPKQEILKELSNMYAGKLMFDIHPRTAYNLADQDFSRVLTLHQDFKRNDLMKEGNKPYSITYRIAYALSNTHHFDLFLRKEYIEIPRFFKEFSKVMAPDQIRIRRIEDRIMSYKGKKEELVRALTPQEIRQPVVGRYEGILEIDHEIVVTGRNFSQKILILNTEIREAKIMIKGAFGTPWFRTTRLIDSDNFYEESEEEIKNLKETLQELNVMDIIFKEMEASEVNSIMLRLRHLRENLEELNKKFGRLAVNAQVAGQIQRADLNTIQIAIRTTMVASTSLWNDLQEQIGRHHPRR